MIDVNWAGVGVAIVAAFVLGFIWYGPLFGKKWAEYMGMTDMQPDKAVMIRAFSLQIVGAFLTAYVLFHSSIIWKIVADAGVQGFDPAPDHMYGFWGALFTWVGFYLPQHFVSISWENKPFGLFLINAGNSFVTLQFMGFILMTV